MQITIFWKGTLTHQIHCAKTKLVKYLLLMTWPTPQIVAMICLRNMGEIPVPKISFPSYAKRLLKGRLTFDPTLEQGYS